MSGGIVKPINIGICGLGTVGVGVFTVLDRNCQEISARTGRALKVTHVSVRNNKPQLDYDGITVVDDVLTIANDPEVDIVVELIGGCELAKKLVLQSIENGKQVVTANKALIALHGNEIFKAAAEKQVAVHYEASVAGGIPIIKAMREGLTANRIQWLAGIINGTGNYILTEMRDHGRDFDQALADAQQLGYAEADPSFDVDGIDACHKLVILASLAFGIPLQFDKAMTEGIRDIERQDVIYAEELGYRIKHLGIAKRTDNGIELRVHPTLVPESQLLAKVDGVMNAILVKADAVGQSLYYGPGAGAEPTASAVIADIIDIARVMGAPYQSQVPALAFHPDTIKIEPVVNADETVSAFYLRMQVDDELGVMTKITQQLALHGINIEAMIQKEPLSNESTVPLVILTSPVKYALVAAAIEEIASFEKVSDKITQIRLDALA